MESSADFFDKINNIIYNSLKDGIEIGSITILVSDDRMDFLRNDIMDRSYLVDKETFPSGDEIHFSVDGRNVIFKLKK